MGRDTSDGQRISLNEVLYVYGTYRNKNSIVHYTDHGIEEKSQRDYEDNWLDVVYAHT